jgi:hypothetical protein
MAVVEIAAQLRSGSAAEREQAFVELLKLEEEHHKLGCVLTVSPGIAAGAPTTARCREIAAVAVACTIPLCEVLVKPVAEVPAQEYHRYASCT